MTTLDLEKLRAYRVPPTREGFDARDTIADPARAFDDGCGGARDRASVLRGRSGAAVVAVGPLHRAGRAGDWIRTEMWWEGDEILFRALVPERQEIVIDGGVATIDAFARAGGDRE